MSNVVEMKQLKDLLKIELERCLNKKINIEEINIGGNWVEDEDLRVRRNLISTLNNLYDQLRNVQADSKHLENWTDSEYPTPDEIKSLSSEMESLIKDTINEVERRFNFNFEQVSLTGSVIYTSEKNEEELKELKFDYIKEEGIYKSIRIL